MAERLRVGMLAPIAWRVPPLHYGPWERVVSLLTEGLVARGVDVTLFATADSLTRARLSSVAPHGYAEDPLLDAKVYECLHIANAFEQAASGAFDILHNHFDFLPLTYARLAGTPLVTTIHGFSSERILPVYRAYNDVSHLVAISAADRHPDLDYAATIHHGIDLKEFTPRTARGDYLLFFGRIHPDKGAHIAIEVARRTGQRLILAGIVQDVEYFRTRIEPFVDSQQIQFVGSVGPAERDAVLGGALALVHLIQFDEPFGLSVIEAMATGTPVIAFGRGSMPELIADGSSGLLVPPDDVEAAVAAVAQARQLDRRAVRAHVERHFTVERMVDDYVRLYNRLLGDAVHAVDDPPRLRRTRPAGGRCDACHQRKAHVHHSRDGLLTVCSTCARGIDVSSQNAEMAIENVVGRAPAAERRTLSRRLAARQAMHTTRRERARPRLTTSER
jgi:glycosyltransferase involved in cell wall biosynthesis